ncbi:MAG: DNA polymerase III subunit gamma/tau [Candidatus Polarisedimenticolaceae bacterium]|nr:DNA polymerase III subunit gamma/tau [Candidatus Polarisedimenticolaceae bacterium]
MSNPDMSYQVLARKWRPRTFSELVGQEHVVRALTNALNGDRVHHAYLFTGTRGVGKTTLARIFAKSLNCENGVTATPCGVCSACQEIDQGRFVDLLEVDAASRTKVDQTRELLDNVPYAPVRGRYKVYLIDEVHMFSASSFNALLKTLEEPPPHVKFLLATTDPQKVPVTVLSRCLQFNLKRLTREQISGQLEKIMQQEALDAEPPALQLLAHAADGSVRDSLSLLDQSIAFGAGQVTEEGVREMLGTLAGEHVHELLDALIDSDAKRLLDKVAALAECSPDFNGLLQALLRLLHKTAICQMLPDGKLDDEGDSEAIQGFAQRLSAEDIQLFYQIGLVGQRDLPLAPDARSGFEMVMLRMLAFKPASSESGQAGTPPAAKARPVSRQAPQSRPAPTPSARPQQTAPPPIASAVNEPAAAMDKDNFDWTAVVTRLNLQGITGQLASHCLFESWDGKTLKLRLDPTAQSMHISSTEERLLQALKPVLGADMRLDVMVGAAISSQAETPAKIQARTKAERQQQAEQSFAEDPMTQALEQSFGARVVPNSVTPVDR